MNNNPETLRAYYAKNKERIRETQRRWTEKRRAELEASGSSFYEHNRSKTLRKLYGITTDDYDAMLDAQDGLCAVCHEPPDGRRLAVDHNHTTGRVRGLLHLKCNAMLGLAKDDPSRLLAGAQYLLDQED